MRTWQKYGPALSLLLMLGLVAVVRIRLLSMPLERDEGEYAYAGQLMLEGEPPYRLIYNMKLPGIYAAYALIMAVFGQSSQGIHLGFMFVNFGAIVLLYFVGRRFLDRAGALAASGVYALLSLSPRVLGLNAHATHFVVLAALGAILVLLRALENGRRAGFFWSGFLFGVAFLMKQPGGAFAIFGLSLLLWKAWRRPAPDWKADAGRAAAYAAGVAAPLVLTGLALWRAGVWDKFWWWTVRFARVHAQVLSWAIGWQRLAGYCSVLSWDALFWCLALAGGGGVAMKKGRADEKFFFLSLLGISAAAVCPGFYFSEHYFVLMLPVISLLAAWAVTEMAAYGTSRSWAGARVAPWALYALAWAVVAWSHRDAFVEWSPQEASARIYPNNDFPVYPILGEYLASHTPPTATFAVLGSEPELLFYAHRRSVTGYIYMYDLVQHQPWRERMASEMISEVERGRPDYIVNINLLFSWLPHKGAGYEAVQQWLANYTQNEYEPCGVMTYSPNQFIWGPDCFQRVPSDNRCITIFQRKHSGATKPTS